MSFSKRGSDRYKAPSKKEREKRPAYIKPTGAKLESINAGLKARRPYAIAIAAIATVAALIALYMYIVDWMGGVPICGPIGGCDVVQHSPYSYIEGGGIKVQVSLIGFLGSVSVIALSAWWWRAGEVRPLQAMYLGMLGATILELYLIYLQLFVIHAICIWCIGYGIMTFATFGAAWIALLRTSRPDMKNPGR